MVILKNSAHYVIDEAGMHVRYKLRVDFDSSTRQSCFTSELIQMLKNCEKVLTNLNPTAQSQLMIIAILSSYCNTMIVLFLAKDKNVISLFGFLWFIVAILVSGLRRSDMNAAHKGVIRYLTTSAWSTRE